MSLVVNYEKKIMKCIDAMGIRVVKWQGWIVERWAFSRPNNLHEIWGFSLQNPNSSRLHFQRIGTILSSYLSTSTQIIKP